MKKSVQDFQKSFSHFGLGSLGCVLLLGVMLLLLCTIARGIMVWHYLPQELWQAHLGDFYAMWFMGFKLDMRAIGIALLGFLVLVYILGLFRAVVRVLWRSKRVGSTRGGGA